MVKFIHTSSSALLLNVRLLLERQGSKQTEKLTQGSTDHTGSQKSLRTPTVPSSEITEKRFTPKKQEQNEIQKGTFKEQEVLHENTIAKIKNYIVGLEDKVIEIIQKVE